MSLRLRRPPLTFSVCFLHSISSSPTLSFCFFLYKLPFTLSSLSLDYSIFLPALIQRTAFFLLTESLEISSSLLTPPAACRHSSHLISPPESRQESHQARQSNTLTA
ncbi:hypothetical protein M440DRAFT_1406351 [Trichoderma longibrachiatum ATCC 18648]|uniref:Uncharacterized protein n=1 Tax=Trichoderma longibrachiatum ATCC 18648 TaxID=983965 RepID=A0A2T4BQM2_TRILO|nr:hypothetical protein M440DRAFT_1406351 [Trichoderma longibrachiatum ATCC 18648]